MFFEYFSYMSLTLCGWGAPLWILAYTAHVVKIWIRWKVVEYDGGGYCAAAASQNGSYWLLSIWSAGSAGYQGNVPDNPSMARSGRAMAKAPLVWLELSEPWFHSLTTHPCPSWEDNLWWIDGLSKTVLVSDCPFLGRIWVFVFALVFAFRQCWPWPSICMGGQGGGADPSRLNWPQHQPQRFQVTRKPRDNNSSKKGSSSSVHCKKAIGHRI